MENWNSAARNMAAAMLSMIRLEGLPEWKYQQGRMKDMAAM